MPWFLKFSSARKQSQMSTYTSVCSWHVRRVICHDKPWYPNSINFESVWSAKCLQNGCRKNSVNLRFTQLSSFSASSTNLRRLPLLNPSSSSSSGMNSSPLTPSPGCHRLGSYAPGHGRRQDSHLWTATSEFNSEPCACSLDLHQTPDVLGW